MWVYPVVWITADHIQNHLAFANEPLSTLLIHLPLFFLLLSNVTKWVSFCIRMGKSYDKLCSWFLLEW
jgi:hypothetical protein